MYHIKMTPALEIAGSSFLEQIYCYDPREVNLSSDQIATADQLELKKMSQTADLDCEIVKNYFDLEIKAIEEDQRIPITEAPMSKAHEGPEINANCSVQANFGQFTEDENAEDLSENIVDEKCLGQDFSTKGELGLLRSIDLNIKSLQNKINLKPKNYERFENDDDYKMMLN